MTKIGIAPTSVRMNYALWTLPTVAVLLPVLTSRVSVVMAAVLGLLLAILVAAASGPVEFDFAAIQISILRGLWIGFIVMPYILGGLLFWRIASPQSAAPSDSRSGEQSTPSRYEQRARRRRIFFACFLIGPFAEGATGFGVGMLGTIALLRPYGFPPRPLMVFAMLSQTFIPYGAMGSGTLLGAAYARLSPTTLGLYILPAVGLLMLVWLPLFWRTLKSVGLSLDYRECLREVSWIMASLGLLALAIYLVGPETAQLTAFGPLIVLRFLLDEKPTSKHLYRVAKRLIPYAVLIPFLMLTRVWSPLLDVLSRAIQVKPFDDLPVWLPLHNAGSWLIIGAIATAGIQRNGRVLPLQIITAWRTGKTAVLTVFLFSMMAEVLTRSGISGAYASGMFDWLGSSFVLVTPLISGGLGILANTGNVPNSLLMPAQVALASDIGVSIPILAALQHVSSSSLGFFSPVRMTIAANLAHAPGDLRATYRKLFPYAGLAFSLLIALAAVLLAAL